MRRNQISLKQTASIMWRPMPSFSSSCSPIISLISSESHTRRHSESYTSMPAWVPWSRSISVWSRGSITMGKGWHASRPYSIRCLLLPEDRQYVAGRVLEPRDVRPLPAGDALLVLLEAVVALKAHAAARKLVDGTLDVVHLEVQDRVGGRGVVGFHVDERVSVAGEMQRHKAV